MSSRSPRQSFGRDVPTTSLVQPCTTKYSAFSLLVVLRKDSSVNSWAFLTTRVLCGMDFGRRVVGTRLQVNRSRSSALLLNSDVPYKVARVDTSCRTRITSRSLVCRVSFFHARRGHTWLLPSSHPCLVVLSTVRGLRQDPTTVTDRITDSDTVRGKR